MTIPTIALPIPANFVIIDDDIISGFVTGKMIQNTFSDAAVVVFEHAEDLLSYFRAMTTGEATMPVYLFADINMPGTNGWELLQKLQNLPASVGNLLRVYLISATSNRDEMHKALTHPQVNGFISKPLTSDKLRSLPVH